MANKGCILGCITVAASDNESIHWTEDPGGGSEAALTTTMTVRDYFLDSATATESIIQELASTMDSISTASGNAWTYTVTHDADTGQITIAADGGEFRLDITGDSDTSWTDFGFGAASVFSGAAGGFTAKTLTATSPPRGTWFARTTDDVEELATDTRWHVHRKGVSIEGCTGKRYTRKWGVTKTRQLTYKPIVGGQVFSHPTQDIDRAATCFEDHWCKGQRVRIYTESRTITTATDDEDIFDAVVTNESFEPARYENHQELDWWEFTLDLVQYVS